MSCARGLVKPLVFDEDACRILSEINRGVTLTDRIRVGSIGPERRDHRACRKIRIALHLFSRRPGRSQPHIRRRLNQGDALAAADALPKKSCIIGRNRRVADATPRACVAARPSVAISVAGIGRPLHCPGVDEPSLGKVELRRARLCKRRLHLNRQP